MANANRLGEENTEGSYSRRSEESAVRAFYLVIKL